MNASMYVLLFYLQVDCVSFRSNLFNKKQRRRRRLSNINYVFFFVIHKRNKKTSKYLLSAPKMKGERKYFFIHCCLSCCCDRSDLFVGIFVYRVSVKKMKKVVQIPIIQNKTKQIIIIIIIIRFSVGIYPRTFRVMMFR